MENQKFRLYFCEANAVDYEPRGMIIAKNTDEAIAKFEKELYDEDIWYAGRISAWEIEIKGFTISVSENN